jgi:hypothetical protein
VREVARVCEACQKIFMRQTRVIGQEILFGLPRGEKFKNEFNGEAGAADDRLSGEDLRVRFNSLSPIHDLMLPAEGCYQLIESLTAIPRVSRVGVLEGPGTGTRDSNPFLLNLESFASFLNHTANAKAQGVTIEPSY